MKAIFYVLSLLAIGAAAFLSNQNKSKFEGVQTARVATITLNKKISANADKTKAELDDESKKLTGAKSALAEVEQSIESLESKARELQREQAELDSELEEQQQKIDDAETGRKKAEVVLRELGIEGPVSIDNIQRKVKELEDTRKTLTADIEELDTNIEAAEGTVAKNREEIDRLSSKKVERNARMRQNAMESVITAVDQDFGFVVIGAGVNSGFKPQTRLIVKRGGRMIAEVTPSAIESTQTIAEIDFDTMKPGVRIQPGDRVILSKTATN